MKKGSCLILFLLYISFNCDYDNYLFALSNEEVKKVPEENQNIIIEEYKVAKDIEELWECFELMCVPEEIIIKRKKWRDLDFIKKMNIQIEPLGYRFIKKDYINSDFYKGEKLLFSNLQDVHGLSFNSSKKRFLFVAEHKRPERTYLDVVILNGKVIDLPLYEGISPSFHNDKIINLKAVKDSSKQEKFEYGSIEVNKETIAIYSFEYAYVEVFEETIPSYLNEKTLYKFDVIEYPFDYAIQQFYVRNGHWILEYMKAKTNGKKVTDYYGTVIVDGENLNEKNGYKEVFSHAFINGKPFYFFEDDSGYTKIKYSGVTLPLKYEKVMHYGCCSMGSFNPEWNDNMIWFFGIKDDHVYYVEVGVYK